MRSGSECLLTRCLEEEGYNLFQRWMTKMHGCPTLNSKPTISGNVLWVPNCETGPYKCTYTQPSRPTFILLRITSPFSTEQYWSSWRNSQSFSSSIIIYPPDGGVPPLREGMCLKWCVCLYYISSCLVFKIHTRFHLVMILSQFQWPAVETLGAFGYL